jgi:hypothetical protein
MTNNASSLPQKLALFLLSSCIALPMLAEESFTRCSRLGRWRECSTVPLASAEQDAAAKQFLPPPADESKIYIVRPTTIDPKKTSTIFLDGERIASLAPMTYLVVETSPGMHHIKAHTDHDFEVAVDLAPGKTYYVRHRLGLLFNTMAGALKVIDEKEGQAEVAKSKLARAGDVQ